MIKNLVLLFVMAALPLTAQAQVVAPTTGAAVLPVSLPVPPNVNVSCVQAAIQYKAIEAYIYGVHSYEEQVVLPALALVTNHDQYDFWMGQYLASNKALSGFLKSCFTNANVAIPWTCKPIDPASPGLTPVTPAVLSSRLLAQDIDGTEIDLNPLYTQSVTEAGVISAFQAAYTTTIGAYCTWYPYAIHPVDITGLKIPQQ
jgi:hypothetical protein